MLDIMTGYDRIKVLTGSFDPFRELLRFHEDILVGIGQRCLSVIVISHVYPDIVTVRRQFPREDRTIVPASDIQDLRSLSPHS